MRGKYLRYLFFLRQRKSLKNEKAKTFVQLIHGSIRNVVTRRLYRVSGKKQNALSCSKTSS